MIGMGSTAGCAGFATFWISSQTMMSIGCRNLDFVSRKGRSVFPWLHRCHLDYVSSKDDEYLLVAIFIKQSRSVSGLAWRHPV
jgi:hypothetical protein